MDNRWILIALLVYMLFWIWLYRNKKQDFDFFDPFYLTSAIYLLVFVYGPWVWLSRGQTSYQGVKVMASLPRASLIFGIGYTAFVLGSMSRVRYTFGGRYQSHPVKPMIDFETERKSIERYALIVYFISMALTLLYYRLIGRSALSLFTLGQLGETIAGRNASGLLFLKCFMRSAIPAAAMLVVFSDKKFLAWSCTIALSILCISSGSRNLAITVILSIFCYLYIDKQKRPRLFTVILLILGFYFLIGLVGTFRTQIKASMGFSLQDMDSETMYSSMMYNIEIFYPFYNIVDYIPRRYPYHMGLGILNVIVQFIPRALWPGKPTMLGMTAFETMYGSSMGGAAYPNIGEFYYEFGIPGVIVFMYLFGYINMNAYDSMRQKDGDKFNNLLYSIYFAYLIQFVCRGHFASWAIDFVFMLAPVTILRSLLRKNGYTEYSAI